MSNIAYSLLLAHLATLSPAEQQNVCLSPYSLQSAFALVQEGANGKTKKEITQTLHTQNFVTLPDAAITEGDPNAVIFEQANSIWINANNHPSIKQTFLDINHKKYHAEISTLPFDAAGQRQINEWCSDKTHGRIDNAIDQLNPGDVMELINAIYFKGSWVTEFLPRFTQKEDFYTPTLDDEPIQVDMMRNTSHWAYGEDARCQIIELPFNCSYDTRQDEYALQIILPAEDTSLLQLDSLLAEGNYQLPSLSHQKVKLSLPKFEINYSADLIPTLQHMGIKQAFTGKANFKRISSTPMQISTVTQKTFFKVDEKGAEAAAVTAIGMRLTSAAPRIEKTYEMTVDHPFMIRLINKTRGNLDVFVGNIFNPNLKGN